MITRKFASAVVLLLTLAVPVVAQQPAQPPRAGGAQAGPGGPGGMRPRVLNVELALRMKDQLKLTDAQSGQLEALRKEIVADRQAKAHDMIDIRSRVAAGLLKREDVRKQFEGQRDALKQTMQSRQERIAKILTTDQQQQLQRAERRFIMQRMRARGMGQRGGFGPMQGRGFRGRGMMRPGFGPGFNQFGPPRPPRPPRGPGGPGLDDQQ